MCPEIEAILTVNAGDKAIENKDTDRGTHKALYLMDNFFRLALSVFGVHAFFFFTLPLTAQYYHQFHFRKCATPKNVCVDF